MGVRLLVAQDPYAHAERTRKRYVYFFVVYQLTVSTCFAVHWAYVLFVPTSFVESWISLLID